MDALLLLLKATLMQKLKLFHATQVTLHLSFFASALTFTVHIHILSHALFLGLLKLIENGLLLFKQMLTLLALLV